MILRLITLYCLFALLPVMAAEDLYDKYKHSLNQPSSENVPASTATGWSALAIELKRLNAMSKGTFESKADFAQRVQAAVTKLENTITEATHKSDRTYQAGTVTMVAYNAENEILSAKLTWQQDVSKLLTGLPKTTNFFIPKQAAAKAFGQQRSQPLYITLIWQYKKLYLDELLLASAGKIYAGDRSTTRYKIKADGTAVDTVTGLMWMRCSLGQTWTGTTCRGEATTFTWDQAKKQTANFAGYNDWRIPTIEELGTLVYCSNAKGNKFTNTVASYNSCSENNSNEFQRPTIVESVFPNTPNEWFWSGSPVAGSPAEAWYVDFDDGVDSGSNRSNGRHVRLVRARQ